jgi:type IV pilus assembly protein PilW
LVVNNASLLNVTLTGNPGASAKTIVTAANSGIPAGRIILAVTSDCTGADLFQKTNSKDSVSLTKGGGQAPGNQTPVNDGFSATYDNGSTIYEFNSTAFFIRQGASGGPSLFMRRLDAGDPFGNVELVEGVENMQVLYGITNSGGQTVVNYVSADNIVSWANVASVRIALLLRSDDGIQDDGLADGEANVGQIYNLLGTQITTEADERARMVGTLTVGIRNRLE